MRYHGLATDYDGTIASHGVVPESTITALLRLKASGRRLILVTGRELGELQSVFPAYVHFDRIVAENGALLFHPGTETSRLLTEPPPAKFVEELRRRGVDPIYPGKAIVATVEPHEVAMLEVIRDLGLEWHVIFNKGSVMALPSGVTKATGLDAALAELHLRPEQIVGVGDAENDHVFLTHCGCGVAVANALQSLKDRADWVTTGKCGSGVEELIERLLTDDLAGLGRAVG
jgi:hydroxymethylpyrimidine pyrophosphatase-like HAD family hydrolase